MNTQYIKLSRTNYKNGEYLSCKLPTDTTFSIVEGCLPYLNVGKLEYSIRLICGDFELILFRDSGEFELKGDKTLVTSDNNRHIKAVILCDGDPIIDLSHVVIAFKFVKNTKLAPSYCSIM